jgi:hypothetical protein
VFVATGNFFYDEAYAFVEFLVHRWVFVAKEDPTPATVGNLSRQELLQGVQIVVRPPELTGLGDVDGGAGFLGLQEAQTVLVEVFVLPVAVSVLLVVDEGRVELKVALSLFLSFMFESDNPVVEILFLEDAVDVVGGEVVAEEFVVNGGAHEDDPYSRVLPDEPLDGEQDEIGVDVAFVDLVQQDEGVLSQDLRAVHHLLKEDAVGHKDDPVAGAYSLLHRYLVADQPLLRHLLVKDALEVEDGQTPRLHAQYL